VELAVVGAADGVPLAPVAQAPVPGSGLPGCAPLRCVGVSDGPSRLNLRVKLRETLC
jgi:hypothetical protein